MKWCEKDLSLPFVLFGWLLFLPFFSFLPHLQNIQFLLKICYVMQDVKDDEFEKVVVNMEMVEKIVDKSWK